MEVDISVSALVTFYERFGFDALLSLQIMISHENKGISNMHLHHSSSSVLELPSPSEDLGCFLSTMKFPPHRQHSRHSTKQKLNNYQSVSLFQKANSWSDTKKWKHTQCRGRINLLSDDIQHKAYAPHTCRMPGLSLYSKN